MFKVRPFEARTLVWWLGEKDNIDFQPTYQRKGALWDRAKKAYLIDSIMNDFDLPKFYLADFTYADTVLNTAKKPYAVIDGRQRLEAIFDFFEGKLALSKDFILSKDPSLQLGGLKYKDLGIKYPRIAGIFDNFNPTVMSVITDEESKINELFVRLNTSTPLSGSEIRNALPGPLPELARNLAKHVFFKEKISFSLSRGQDLDVAFKLLLIEHRGELVDTKRIHLDSLVLQFVQAESNVSEVERAAARVVAVLDEMVKVFEDKDYLLRTQGPATVYYWLVRNTLPKYRRFIREFLVGFEDARAHNRKVQAETGHFEDEELALFDTLSRSINDQGSLRQRYSILANRLAAFTGSRG